MSQQDKRMEVSCKVYNLMVECDNMEQALAVLTDTIAATVAANIEDKTERALLMGACIKRLRIYKKHLNNDL